MKAIITGVTGQDGSYLAELLLKKGYEVIGLKRRSSTICTERIDGVYNHPNFKLRYFNLNDSGCFWRLLLQYQPDEVYNLAAQSHVKVSFETPEETVTSIALGTLRQLEAIRVLNPAIKFYQASSSEMFGINPNYPCNESSTFMPASPYACAKVFAHNLVKNYRTSYGLYACSGILFNHESPRRGETFVTRKISLAAAKIKLGRQKKLYLGNLDARRDWGYAGDYVEAMWLMLQHNVPDDFVVATGIMRAVKDFVKCVFDYANLDYKKYVIIDDNLKRPQEVPALQGDFAKAKQQLNWKPKVTFEQLATMMFEHDYEKLKKEK